MNSIINKLPKIALYVLMGVTVLLGILFFVGGESTTTYNNIEYSEPALTNALMIWVYILAFLAVGITLAFVIVRFVMDAVKAPKSAVRPLAVLVGAILLFGICYALGNGTPLNLPGYDGADNVPSWLKATDMFLYVVYILLIVAFVSIVYSGVSKLIKK